MGGRGNTKEGRPMSADYAQEHFILVGCGDVGGLGCGCYLDVSSKGSGRYRFKDKDHENVHGLCIRELFE